MSAFSFFKPQTVQHWWCCGHCDMSHVATVSNHIQKKKKQRFSMARSNTTVSKQVQDTSGSPSSEEGKVRRKPYTSSLSLIRPMLLFLPVPSFKLLIQETAFSDTPGAAHTMYYSRASGVCVLLEIELSLHVLLLESTVELLDAASSVLLPLGGHSLLLLRGTVTILRVARWLLHRHIEDTTYLSGGLLLDGFF